MQKTKRYYFFYKNYNTRNKINKKNIITLQKTKYLKTKKAKTQTISNFGLIKNINNSNQTYATSQNIA